jgi:diguanylate cyclase (GGDEF)-like protein
MAARYGGEEFAILLPETDVAGASQIVGELQAAICTLDIPHEGGPLGVVTLSAGVACLSPNHRTATSSSLIEEADAALYEAKAQGRNTFVVNANVDSAALAPFAEHRNAA